MGHHLEFSCIGSGILQFLHLAIELLGLVQSLADGSVVRPSNVARHHAEMADHRNTLVSHSLDDS